MAGWSFFLQGRPSSRFLCKTYLSLPVSYLHKRLCFKDALIITCRDEKQARCRPGADQSRWCTVSIISKDYSRLLALRSQYTNFCFCSCFSSWSSCQSQPAPHMLIGTASSMSSLSDLWIWRELTLDQQ